MSFAYANRRTPNVENSKKQVTTEEPPAAAPKITDEYFSNAYKKGFHLTVRFLLSRGVSQEAALDTAQAAWTRGWERREQLRHPSLVLTWTNTIALNIYRTMLRRERQTEPLTEVEASTSLNFAAMDVERILKECKPNDRIVLEAHYLDGYKATEIAQLRGCSETAVRIRLLRARRKLQCNLISAKPRRLLALGQTALG
jgi:RNA polymerase sigma-70 factor (ECF subfamily)